MKKIILLFLTFSLFACNDGDFDVPAFEFTDTVNSCGEYILYKTNSNGTEAIVLTLSPTDLGTIEGEKSIPISTVSSVIYRIFKEGIEANYFCQDIPPATPIVVKELIAESGTINITTTANLTDGVITSYTYEISISNLLFNDTNERILFENFYFGTL
ncbi:hypothetical protein Lupro_03405 [Lutibacter profundi]|uniref:Uncharacterized protein n=1 Tax=Lutibacter profundi TaxID=1622118 RepID=A0A0X8G5F1_9FLAO|nr:hypothetical protein [Lutibacter profundi]AMC10354.1 hypothetical protein Lupro_03405 [Lutibacter profundi]